MGQKADIGTILRIRTKFDFLEKFDLRKKNLLLGRLVKNTEKLCPIYSRQNGVRDGHRPGKNWLLSDFYPIVIIFLEVNNGHASESKCTLWQEKYQGRENM